MPSQLMTERDAVQRALEVALEENRRLRKLLRELRKVIITNKHKELIDQELKASK